VSASSQTSTATTTPEAVPIFKAGDRVKNLPDSWDRGVIPGTVRDVDIFKDGRVLVHVNHDDGSYTAWDLAELEPETAPLGGESCPKCKSAEAWHGVITEPGEAERYACDACGMNLAIQVSQPEPPKPRRFGFTVEVFDGELFIETAAGDTVLSVKPGWYLQIGSITINGPREADRLERMWTDVGREVGRREAAQS
jgi:hypothetical protein